MSRRMVSPATKVIITAITGGIGGRDYTWSLCSVLPLIVHTPFLSHDRVKYNHMIGSDNCNIRSWFDGWQSAIKWKENTQFYKNIHYSCRVIRWMLITVILPIWFCTTKAVFKTWSWTLQFIKLLLNMAHWDVMKSDLFLYYIIWHTRFIFNCIAYVIYAKESGMIKIMNMPP